MAKEMTKEQWENIHQDYKTIIDGQKYILEWVDGKGTCLVPVNIEEEQQFERMSKRFDYLETELTKIWANLYWLNRWYPKKIEQEYKKVDEMLNNLSKPTEQDTPEDLKRKFEQVEDTLMKAQEIYDKANNRVKGVIS